MPADRMSGDRMPTAEEARVLAWVAEQDSPNLRYWSMPVLWRLAKERCERAGWLTVRCGCTALADSGRAALAAYRAAHGEGRG